MADACSAVVWWHRFQAIDANNDRTLSEEEFVRFFSSGQAQSAAAVELMGGEAVQEDWESLLSRIDTDGDGTISPSELQAFISRTDPQRPDAPPIDPAAEKDLYIARVLKPLRELRHHGWFDPPRLLALAKQRLEAAEDEASATAAAEAAARGAAEAAAEGVSRAQRGLASADAAIESQRQYVRQYVNLPVRDCGTTPLIAAVNLGEAEDRGSADPACPTARATGHACSAAKAGVSTRGGCTCVAPILGQLLQANAGCDVTDLDQPRRDGVTALHAAAGRGYVGALRQLADAGADLEALDRQGRTALSKAEALGQTASAAALRSISLARSIDSGSLH
eukprot:COSAG01_NODE_329_length_18724_cov_18.613423_5_plen_337_part_00